MSRFVFTVEVSASYASNIPTLEVLVGGVVVSSVQVTAHGPSSNVFTFELDYSGNYPSSLSLRFNDGLPESGRSLTLAAVQVNGQDVSTTYITQMVLTQGQSAGINTAATDHLFGRVEPNAPDLGTPTVTGSSGDDVIDGGDEEDIIDAGAGNDVVFGKADNDRIMGGPGDDFLDGGAGNDIIIGGPGVDRIFGGPGNDLLFGSADKDLMIGGAGNDVMNGGAGNDSMLGGSGNDILYGENGNDVLLGDAGNDTLYGDSGNDIILGGAGNDTLYGGADDDRLMGEAGDDTIYGEAGIDFIVGGAGNDTIDGGDGEDTIFAEDGNDVVSGGNDDDVLMGEAGNDTLSGDAGNDTLIGGAGADTLNGGADNDMLFGHAQDSHALSALIHANAGVAYYAETNSFYRLVSTAETFANAEAAAAALTLGGVAGHLATITSQTENTFLQYLANGNTVWIGATDAGDENVWVWKGGLEDGVQFASGVNAVNNFFVNWGGSDPNHTGDSAAVLEVDGAWYDRAPGQTHYYIVEWEGAKYGDDNAADILNGDSGADILTGDGGTDTLSGGDGNDQIYGGDGNDALNGNDGNDFLLDFSGTNSFDGGAGDDILDARYRGGGIAPSIGVQTMSGGTGNDTIYGGSGADVINGGDDDDTIYGNLGADTISGGDGNDFLYANLDAGSGGAISVLSNIAFSPISSGVQQDFWANTATPAIITDSDATAVELGLKFQSSVDGIVTGLQFYKGPSNTGTHEGHLWASDGTMLAEVVFSGETASGWQTAYFASSVAIDANTTYIISYYAPNSHYSANNSYFTSSRTSGNLTAPVDAGVYTYGPSDSFPVSTYQSSNYWVDVLFESASSNTQGFTYADDALGLGSSSGIYASGSYRSGDGGVDNGSLEIVLGGQNNTTQTNMDGGWQKTITVSDDLQNVEVSFSYRMLHASDYESDEDSFVYVKLDGVFYGLNGNNYVARYEDVTDPSDSGWVSVTLDIGNLGAGDHTLVLGGFNEKKNSTTEVTTLRFDDISVTGDLAGYQSDTAANTVNGGNGNDTIYGAEGNSVLNGDAGVDTIYSASVDTLSSQISAILSAHSGVVYNEDTGSFYLFVNSTQNWSNAKSGASGQSINSVAGHLVQVTSQAENAYVDNLAGGNTVWMGGTDEATEGTWKMLGGPMNGLSFWSGTSGGSVQNGFYTNWSPGQPNASNGDADGLVQLNGGLWDDSRTNVGTINRYVVEWEGSSLLTPASSTTISGGSGADNLYGSDGNDVFMFLASDGAGSIDHIYNYDRADLDKIDIGDLLTGYTAGSSDPDAFAKFVTSGSDTLLQVDANGATGGSSYTTIAQIHGVTGINIEEMVANGLLVMT